MQSHINQFDIHEVLTARHQNRLAVATNVKCSGSRRYLPVCPDQLHGFKQAECYQAGKKAKCDLGKLRPAKREQLT